MERKLTGGGNFSNLLCFICGFRLKLSESCSRRIADDSDRYPQWQTIRLASAERSLLSRLWEFQQNWLETKIFVLENTSQQISRLSYVITQANIYAPKSRQLIFPFPNLISLTHVQRVYFRRYMRLDYLSLLKCAFMARNANVRKLK